MRRYAGFTLFEVFIAMSMGIIFCLGSYQLLYAVKVRWQQQQAEADMLENGVYLQYFFAKRLQDFEHLTCRSESQTVELIPYVALKSNWRRQVKKQSDVLQLGECDSPSGQFRSVRYFIAKTNRRADNKQMIYGLYQKKASGRREEVLPDVANMTLKSADVDADHWQHQHLALTQPSLIKLQFALVEQNVLPLKSLLWPVVLKT